MSEPIPSTPTAFDAASRIVAQVAASRRLASERRPLSRCDGRILSCDVIASIALPAFDNSAMDGYAVRQEDVARGSDVRLRVAGEQFAGAALGLAIEPGTCIRVTTGAALPAGTDAVVVKEAVRVEGDSIVVAAGSVRRGAHLRRAGEDVRVGDRVLQAGVRLTPTRLALAAALGIDQLEVSRPPTVAVFTTGDELVEPGIALQPGQVHDSNRSLLMGLLRADGLEPTAWPILPDDPARIASMLRDAADAFDVVLTCGGVSAGERDHLPALLHSEGVVHFWKVRMKPGMPVLFASLGASLVLALPGNPVSVLATYLTLGRALLDGLQGRVDPRERWHARLSAPFEKRNSRREFLRGRLLPGADGTLLVEPNPADGSHRLAAAAASNALVVLPEGERAFAAGDLVEVMAF